MKVGDLVRLTNIAGGALEKLRGIVLDICTIPPLQISVLWTDGDRTKEFPKDLEVVCK